MLDEYWVKYKGRVQGPFTLSQLNRGIKRGKLSRSHSVSSDRRTWRPLGDVMAEAMAAPPPPPTSEGFPLTPDQGVPQAPFAQPAAHQPAAHQPAAPSPQAHTPAASHGAGQPVTSAFAPGAAPAVHPESRQVSAEGGDAAGWLYAHGPKITRQILIGGIAVVVAFLIPFMVGPDGQLLWLWQTFNLMPTAFQTGMIVWSLTGVAMIVLALCTDGLARSIPTVAVGVLSVILIIAVCSTAIPTGPAVILFTSVLMCASLVALSKWRMTGPTRARRALTCIIGSLVALASLIGLITTISELSQRGGIDLPSEIRSAATVFTVLGFVMLACGMTAGILGILCVNAHASRSLMRLCGVFAGLVPALLSGLFATGACFGALTELRGSDISWVYPMIAMVYIFAISPLFLLGGFGGALYELLLTCSASAQQRALSQPPAPAIGHAPAPQAVHHAPPGAHVHNTPAPPAPPTPAAPDPFARPQAPPADPFAQAAPDPFAQAAPDPFAQAPPQPPPPPPPPPPSSGQNPFP
ncbi:MAG: hypothetical protein MK101_09730 [Phycisphaerales bacterium]|nr:hypothetical protein [Phycisphaerales bacterium]